MNELQRILVPIDGSNSSDAAVAAAIVVASSRKVKLDFIYVANLNAAIGEYPLSTKAVFPNSILENVIAHGKTILANALAEVPKFVAADGRCVSGVPAKVILQVAQELNCDLIIMGHRGLSMVKGLLVGSVSRFLIENAKCPVMVVKANETKEKQGVEEMSTIKHILVPVDGSDTSDRAIEQAIALAKVCEAQLDFLYVANINQLAINACLSDAILEAVTKAGNVILDRALEKVPEDIKAEGFSETGSPAVVILDFANTESCDLIVMGSRGLGVVKGVLLGSVSQHLIEQAKCPVMVVK